jgi:hypothetical protein
MIDKNLHVIWIENKTFRKKWSFYFIKGSEVKCRNNIDQSYVYVDNFWEKCRCLILILVKKSGKTESERRANWSWNYQK